MAAQPFSTLYTMVRPWAKKAPIPAIDNAIRDAAREFCFMSKFRRVPIVDDVVVGQRDYDLTPENADEEVVLIQAAEYMNSAGRKWPLTPVQPEQAPNWPQIDSGQQPSVFWTKIPSQISIWRLPQEPVESGLIVQCIVQPTLTSRTIDSSIIQQYDNTIAWGALSRLLERNDEPWSNPNLALRFEQRFKEGINKAMTDAGFGFQPFNAVSAVYRF